MKNGCKDPLEKLGAVLIYESRKIKRYDCRRFVAAGIYELLSPVIEIDHNGCWSLSGRKCLNSTPRISAIVTKAILAVPDFYEGAPSDGSLDNYECYWGSTVANSFHFAGIYKIKDLLSMSKDDILKLKNIGPVKLDKILFAVHVNGMKFDWE